MVLLDVALSKRRNHLERGARVIIPSVHHHCSQIIWRFLTHDAVGNAKFGFPIKCGSGKLLGSGQVLLARKINFVFLPYLEHEGIYYSINNIFDIPAVKCTCYSEVTSWNSMDFIWRSLPSWCRSEQSKLIHARQKQKVSPSRRPRHFGRRAGKFCRLADDIQSSDFWHFNVKYR